MKSFIFYLQFHGTIFVRKKILANTKVSRLQLSQVSYLWGQWILLSRIICLFIVKHNLLPVNTKIILIIIVLVLVLDALDAISISISINKKGKGKAIPLQAWSGPEGSWKLRFPDFMTTAQDGGKVVSLTHRPPLPPGNAPGTHFC